MSTDTLSPTEPQAPAASPRPMEWRRLLWVVSAAVAAATLANVIFYFILTIWIGEPLLMAGEDRPPVMAPMDVWEVVLVSIIFASAASFVYVILILLTQRPERNFIIVSAVILLVSFVPLLGVPNSPVAFSARLSLVAMHIIGAIVVVGLLVGLGRKRS